MGDRISACLAIPLSAVSAYVIAANEYRRVRWKNGLGWTREILRQPDHEDWDWRLSIAEIEQDRLPRH